MLPVQERSRFRGGKQRNGQAYNCIKERDFTKHKATERDFKITFHDIDSVSFA